VLDRRAVEAAQPLLAGGQPGPQIGVAHGVEAELGEQHPPPGVGR
jgi:hypothetical protein